MTDPTTGGQPPVPPGWTWRDRERATRIRGVYLDPDLQPAGTPEVHSTVYEADVLLIAPPGKEDVEQETTIRQLSQFASQWGWVVEPQDLQDPVPSAPPGAGTTPLTPPRRRVDSQAGTIRARITISPDADPSRPIQRPDAWRLLREARKPPPPAQPGAVPPEAPVQGLEHVSLNHILSVDPIGVNPFKANPFKANPFKANPFKANPAGGIDAYSSPGFGGRQPVYWTGSRPHLDADVEIARRPVVAILDTGCSRTHPWFAQDVILDLVDPQNEALGIDDAVPDPEIYPSLADPLDGVIDEAAGHGTFIAGLVLQSCPHAQIVPVRVSDGQGIILENELISALGQILELLKARKTTIDVLNLSFSYYHESPERAAVEGELYRLLKDIRAQGCVVVCSAGNDATDRPASPAALYAHDDSEVRITRGTGADAPKGESPRERAAREHLTEEADLAPQVVVGALNPSGLSVALFSNIGKWVTTYAPGVAVVSSIPQFEGGAQADLRLDAYDRRRETLDIDDFTSGYAVWSGTSFAAPLVAGLIAKELTTSSKGEGIARGAERSLTAIVEDVYADIEATDRSTEGVRPGGMLTG